MIGARGGAAIALALVLACTDQPDTPEPASSPSTTPIGAADAPADSLDRWTKSEVIKRLAEAGLVVSDSGSVEPFPPLRNSGDRLLVSGSELRIYLYEDATRRASASAALDTTTPDLGYATEWRKRPRVILVNNLIALHFTPNDRLAERVDNVLRARHLGR